MNLNKIEFRRQKRKLNKLREAVIKRLEFSREVEKKNGKLWNLWSNQSYNLSKTKREVSVVITSFNYSNFIKDAIISVFNSLIFEIPNGVELIIVDDCSTDNTVDFPIFEALPFFRQC